MPEAKTLLDKLVRTLNVRKDAWGRYNRRKHAPDDVMEDYIDMFGSPTNFR